MEMKRTLVKDVVENGQAYRISANVAIVDLALKTQKPYFSITGKMWPIDSRGLPVGRDAGISGCIHEAIDKYFPELHNYIALHLSDIDGVPMHAEANALYYAGATKYQDAANVKHQSNHLRITQAFAEYLIDALAVGKVEPWLPDFLAPVADWKAATRIFIMVLEDGQEAGKVAAREELMRLASNMDLIIAERAQSAMVPENLQELLNGLL
jgi:hypothetical protein